jgi:hypothetical protein
MGDGSSSRHASSGRIAGAYAGEAYRLSIDGLSKGKE